jgi:hypothetical protein
MGGTFRSRGENKELIQKCSRETCGWKSVEVNGSIRQDNINICTGDIGWENMYRDNIKVDMWGIGGVVYRNNVKMHTCEVGWQIYTGIILKLICGL